MNLSWAAELVEPTLIGMMIVGVGFLSLFCRRWWSREDDVAAVLRKDLTDLTDRYEKSEGALREEIMLLRVALARVVPTVEDLKVRDAVVALLIRATNTHEESAPSPIEEGVRGE